MWHTHTHTHTDCVLWIGAKFSHSKAQSTHRAIKSSKTAFKKSGRKKREIDKAKKCSNSTRRTRWRRSSFARYWRNSTLLFIIHPPTHTHKHGYRWSPQFKNEEFRLSVGGKETTTTTKVSMTRARVCACVCGRSSIVRSPGKSRNWCRFRESCDFEMQIVNRKSGPQWTAHFEWLPLPNKGKNLINFTERTNEELALRKNGMKKFCRDSNQSAWEGTVKNSIEWWSFELMHFVEIKKLAWISSMADYSMWWDWWWWCCTTVRVWGQLFTLVMDKMMNLMTKNWKSLWSV